MCITDLSFPSVFAPSDSDAPFISKYKQSLQKRLSLSRMKELFDEVDLAVYLAAADRNGDAWELVNFLSNAVTFSGNFNIWTPVGYAMVLQAKLDRILENDTDRVKLLRKLHDEPFHVPIAPTEIKTEIQELGLKIETAYGNPSKKWGCQVLSRTILRVCFYSETAGGNFTTLEPDLEAELDALYNIAMTKLLTRMT